MAVKKKKKIKKNIQPMNDVQQEKQQVVEEEKEYFIPESARSEFILRQKKEELRIEEVRNKEISSYNPPEGYTICMVLSHGHVGLEEDYEYAERELHVKRKIRPEFFYQVVRTGYYSTVIIRRKASKTEEAENLKSKKK